MGLIMELKDFATEELREELKRRHEQTLAKRRNIKRCRMCKHWGEVNYYGDPTTENSLLGMNRCCKFFTNRTGKYHKCHKPSQLACEHFEEK